MILLTVGCVKFNAEAVAEKLLQADEFGKTMQAFEVHYSSKA